MFLQVLLILEGTSVNAGQKCDNPAKTAQQFVEQMANSNTQFHLGDDICRQPIQSPLAATADQANIIRLSYTRAAYCH
jgi:hypothetical protein